MMGNSRDQMMQKVYETGFALDDLLLYLDTHPDDAQAMEYYRYAQNANREAIKAYENVYGPLMMNHVTSNNWSWMKSPWPWEGGAC